MVNKIETCSQLRGGKFLYFENPPELYVGPIGVAHDVILAKAIENNRKPVEVAVAGGISASTDFAIVDGLGSFSLGITKKDPAPVVKFLKNLPDAGDYDISAR